MVDQPLAPFGRSLALRSLEQALGHNFAKQALLEEALTHRSFGQPHNERLEFLGDAVLSLVISMVLLDRFAQCDEGELSRLRASLVRASVLHAVALDLELGPYLRLGAGEARTGGATKASILGDAVEALIGAVFLDGGFHAADRVVRCLFSERVKALDPEVSKDSKTRLQEILQARRQALPAYTVIRTRGEAHSQEFEVECRVGELGWQACGRGRSRRSAEQAAAQALLERHGFSPPPAAGLKG